MVFPVETEQRVKRRALNVCQEHLRKVVEITRKVPLIIDCFIKNDKITAKRLFLEMRKGIDEVDAARRQVSEELAEIGAILINREDFLRFTNLTDEIADYCEGLGFWIFGIMEHEWKVPSEIKEGLMKLAEATLATVTKLRETALTLNYDSSKALEKAKDVEVAERLVDELYRELEIKIVNSKIELPAMLLLRDIIRLLEDAADRAEDASDAARILSFTL
jgi:predicted phosphate transport protein (TIGR00153 family)